MTEQPCQAVFTLATSCDHAPRCASCDHFLPHHGADGCWYTVGRGKPGTNLVCPCDVPADELQRP